MPKETHDNLKVSSTFQKRLADLIFDLDYKRKDLSKHLGVSKTVIERALNYSIIPKPCTLIKIADKLEVSICYLLGFIEDDQFIKSDLPTTFQKRFEELKSERKLKNNQISTNLLIDRSYFSIWKRENYIPSLEFLVDLSKFFKVSIDYLLGRTDDK